MTETVKEAGSMAIHIICISDNMIRRLKKTKYESSNGCTHAAINCFIFLTIALRTFMFVYLYTAWLGKCFHS